MSRRGLVVLALASVGAAELGQLVLQPGPAGFLPAFWPPVGVLLAALVLSEPRRWIPPMAVVCAAMALSDLLHGRDPMAAAIAAAVRGFEAGAAAWLIRRMIGGPLELDRLTHSLALIVVAGTMPVLGGLMAGSLTSLAGSAPFLSLWRGWYLGDTVGMIATAPLAVAILTTTPTAILAHVKGWQAVEIGIALAGALAVVDGVFGGRLDPSFRVPAFLLPFMLWPALRFGAGASAVTTFALSFVSLWYSARGEGPAAMFDTSGALLRAQAGVGLAGASLFLLATVVAERKRSARERDQLVRELQQALSEIKTLQGFIPICAWCHKIRDDAGYWQELEQYLDERTDATFSHGICPTCVEQQTRDTEGLLGGPRRDASVS